MINAGVVQFFRVKNGQNWHRFARVMHYQGREHYVGLCGAYAPENAATPYGGDDPGRTCPKCDKIAHTEGTRQCQTATTKPS